MKQNNRNYNSLQSYTKKVYVFNCFCSTRIRSTEDRYSKIVLWTWPFTRLPNKKLDMTITVTTHTQCNLRHHIEFEFGDK